MIRVVNFAISKRDKVTGIRHLGIQVETAPNWLTSLTGSSTQIVPC